MGNVLNKICCCCKCFADKDKKMMEFDLADQNGSRAVSSISDDRLYSNPNQRTMIDSDDDINVEVLDKSGNIHPQDSKDDLLRLPSSISKHSDGPMSRITSFGTHNIEIDSLRLDSPKISPDISDDEDGANLIGHTGHGIGKSSYGHDALLRENSQFGYEDIARDSNDRYQHTGPGMVDSDSD